MEAFSADWCGKNCGWWAAYGKSSGSALGTDKAAGRQKSPRKEWLLLIFLWCARQGVLT